MEPVGADRLQGRPGAVQGRPTGGRLREFPGRLLGSGVQRAEVWGRPAALAVAKDGSLLVADDTGGTIWRIAYTGPRQQSGKPTESSGAAPRQ